MSLEYSLLARTVPHTKAISSVWSALFLAQLGIGHQAYWGGTSYKLVK